MGSYTVSAAIDQSSVVRGNVALVGGTWTAKTSAADMEIVTGGSKVLFSGYTVSGVVGAATASLVNWDYNQTNGTITAKPATTQEGDWWAIVQL